MAENRIINIAILGAGNIARSMAQAVIGIKNRACLYAVASRSLDKAKKFADEYGVKISYGSYEEMVSDENIDLVYVATPHSLHYESAKLCLENGKNCLVEKAFCGNAKQAQKLIDLAREKNLFLAEAMWTRYQPSREIIKEIIDSKVIGEIKEVEADFSISARGVERLEKPELAGGALLDLGIYSLTVPYMFIDSDVVDTKVEYIMNEYGVDLTDEIELHYANGVKANVKCSFGLEYSSCAKFTGDKGYFTYDAIYAPTKIIIFDNEGNLMQEKNVEFMVNGYEYEVLSSRRAIIEGRKETKEMPLSESLKMMKVMDDIRKQIGLVYPFENEA